MQHVIICVCDTMIMVAEPPIYILWSLPSIAPPHPHPISTFWRCSESTAYIHTKRKPMVSCVNAAFI